MFYISADFHASIKIWTILQIVSAYLLNYVNILTCKATIYSFVTQQVHSYRDGYIYLNYKQLLHTIQ